MTRFDPVHLPADKGLESRLSATFLGKYNWCPRSAYLYQLYKGESRSSHMERGSGLHAITERATLTALEQNEPTIPPELVKAIADEVLADPEFAIPVEEHDALREMSYRWAASARFDVDAVVAVERLFVFDLAGFEVRCKIDFAQLREAGKAVLVTDYKSSRYAPPYEEISRKRPDDTRAAKNLQLILYAMALAYGVPVWVEPCAECRGEGVIQPHPVEHHDPHVCGDCEGRGRIETRRTEGVAPNVQRFDLEFVFPAIPDQEEKPLRRPVTLTRLELGAYRESIAGLLHRVRVSEETGDWPAIVSDEACGKCPAKSCCPIPSELRDHRGEIETVEQAAEVAELWDEITRQMSDVRKEIKAFCAEHEIELRYGNRVFEFVPVTRKRTDKHGQVVESSGTDFRPRDLTANEMTEGSK